MKLVINTCGGWFQLSDRARSMLEMDECSLPYESDHKLRSDAKLVSVVERLGRRAAGIASQLSIVEVPDGTNWMIYTDGDGREFVLDRDRVWGLPLPPEKKEE